MNKNLVIPNGWNLVAISTLLILIMLVAIGIVNGIDESSLRIAIRQTARISVVLFLGTFISTAVRRFYPGKMSNWLLKNRRYLGISFAISHLFHALAIIGLAIISTSSISGSGGGTLGYMFIGLMMITFFDKTAELLGYRSWKILHTIGSYYIWGAFVVAFSKRIPNSPEFYIPMTVILVLAMLLKIGAYWYHPKSIDS